MAQRSGQGCVSMPRDPSSPEYPDGCYSMGSLGALADYLIQCRACLRLVEYRETVAHNPPLQFAGQKYWANPVPGFGDPSAKILVTGLAPSATGSNRTGRMFTGDKSADFLVAGFYRAGFANQPTSTARDDGLILTGVYLTAAVRCAPPENKPTALEATTCRPYLARELELIKPQVLIALGGIGWNAILRTLAELGARLPTPRPKFAHATEVTLTLDSTREITLLGCYHPSPQNTNTGRLTAQMLDDVLTHAKQAQTRGGTHWQTD